MRPIDQRPLPAPGTPLRQALEMLYDKSRELHSLTHVIAAQTRLALRPWCGLALDRPVSPTHIWRLTPRASERLSKARKRAEAKARRENP